MRRQFQRGRGPFRQAPSGETLRRPTPPLTTLATWKNTVKSVTTHARAAAPGRGIVRGTTALTPADVRNVAFSRPRIGKRGAAKAGSRAHRMANPASTAGSRTSPACGSASAANTGGRRVAAAQPTELEQLKGENAELTRPVGLLKAATALLAAALDGHNSAVS
jgi:hypothetical protein